MPMNDPRLYASPYPPLANISNPWSTVPVANYGKRFLSVSVFLLIAVSGFRPAAALRIRYTYQDLYWSSQSSTRTLAICEIIAWVELLADTGFSPVKHVSSITFHLATAKACFWKTHINKSMVRNLTAQLQTAPPFLVSHRHPQMQLKSYN